MAASGLSLSGLASKNVPLLVLYAIILGAIAFLEALQSSFVGTFTLLLLAGSAIAGITIAFEVYQKGTPTGTIPVKTLASAIVTAVIYIATWALGQTTLNEASGIAGALLFLTFLEAELFPSTPTSVSTPAASGPPSPSP